MSHTQHSGEHGLALLLRQLAPLALQERPSVQCDTQAAVAQRIPVLPNTLAL